MIYHVIEKKAYLEACAAGVYHPESLDREGFIHCSGSEEDALAVANNFYHGKEILVLGVDDGAAGSKVRWETPTHEMFNRPFPHLYGEIDPGKISGIMAVRKDEHGRFTGFTEQ